MNSLFVTFLNKSELICLHSQMGIAFYYLHIVKWFHVLLTLTVLFAHSLKVSGIAT